MGAGDEAQVLLFAGKCFLTELSLPPWAFLSQLPEAFHSLHFY